MSANSHREPSYAQASRRLDALLSNARNADVWDSARSRRVFEGAVKSRGARHRRQRFVTFVCAASAAMFVLGVHAASAHSHSSFQNANDDSGESAQVSNTGDSLGISGGIASGITSGTSGAIAMSSDMFADGGRETD
jgi:hypothetical protein